jgi:beta-lactamase superfamily II metal-dependent hydrolase
VATAIRLEALPARLGDCLLVECLRADGPPWRMLVDGGPSDTWPLLEARLARLPEGNAQIDVAVVTHVDSDHIGGFLPFVASDVAREQVRDFWFNGHQHLPQPRETTRSIAQGESLAAALTGGTAAAARTAALPWNVAFDGGPIETPDETGFVEAIVPDGPRITVLSPTRKRLSILAAKWFEALEAAQRRRRDPPGPDVLGSLDDLAALASEKSPKDGSAPNGSSIALLVEHRGASVLLSGDAFGDVLGAGLKRLADARGVDAVPVDAFKLPHHGSRGNVIEAMLALAPAQHYVFSSNGDTFHHPDDAAVARSVLAAPDGATLWFNYRTPRTERWGDPALCREHRYSARFPEDPDAGAVLELLAKE